MKPIISFFLRRGMEGRRTQQSYSCKEEKRLAGKLSSHFLGALFVAAAGLHYW